MIPRTAIGRPPDDEPDAVRSLSHQPEDLDAYIADFGNHAAECERTYGTEYLASITIDNAARDMETATVAIGDEPLNYFGVSYGTAIGSVHATLFPDSIRTMVLDAVVPTDRPTARTSHAPRASRRHWSNSTHRVSNPSEGVLIAAPLLSADTLESVFGTD